VLEREIVPRFDVKQQKLSKNKNKFHFYVLLELQLTEKKFNHLQLYNIYRVGELPPKKFREREEMKKIINLTYPVCN